MSWLCRLKGLSSCDPAFNTCGGLVAPILAVAIVLSDLPNLRTQSIAAEPESKQTANDSKDRREFSLQVVKPDGKPVPNAEVEIRIMPDGVKPEQVTRGQFAKAGRSGA